MTLFSVAIRCHTNDSGEKPHHHRAFHDPHPLLSAVEKCRLVDLSLHPFVKCTSRVIPILPCAHSLTQSVTDIYHGTSSWPRGSLDAAASEAEQEGVTRTNSGPCQHPRTDALLPSLPPLSKLKFCCSCHVSVQIRSAVVEREWCLLHPMLFCDLVYNTQQVDVSSQYARI